MNSDTKLPDIKNSLIISVIYKFLQSKYYFIYGILSDDIGYISIEKLYLLFRTITQSAFIAPLHSSIFGTIVFNTSCTANCIA